MLPVLAVLIALVAPLFSSILSTKTQQGNNNLVIDLGYQQNQGYVVNESLVTFRNVRFAAAPIGDLRFKAPQPPPVNRTATPINATDVICPQAYPKWLTTGNTSPFTPDEIPPVDPRTSEDCLVLDVLMPKHAWDERKVKSLPILVWIYGGGFDIGWKDASGAGHGLVSRSLQYSRDGVILVSINYRLGLFGWMNGEGVTPNAGLLDQRFALDWVQTYIRSFGGDPHQVTVLGESAGASSIEAHITSYGGSKGRVPFRGAIMQSPYFLPTYPLPNSYVDAILKFGNVSTLGDLRKMSSGDLQTLNALLIGNSKPFGSFTFGAVPDNDYIPTLPGKLFKQGGFDRHVSVMTGHNSDEGSRFVPNTQITDDALYAAYLGSLLLPLQNDSAALDMITKSLYPPIFNGSQGYMNQTQRNNLTIADAALVCNARFMDQAPFTWPTYAYAWSLPPGLHGADLPYTFYDFGDVPGVDTKVATTLQGYILAFTVRRDPNAPGLPHFAIAGDSGSVQNLDSQYVGPMPDEGGVKRLGERCDYWQDVPYLARYQ